MRSVVFHFYHLITFGFGLVINKHLPPVIKICSALDALLSYLVSNKASSPQHTPGFPCTVLLCGRQTLQNYNGVAPEYTSSFLEERERPS